MTGPNTAGPDNSPPPEWFRQGEHQHGERALLQQVRDQREVAQRVQAERAQAELGQAQHDAVARAYSTRNGPPGRQTPGPVRQNQAPWIGVPPGAMFLAAEDATLLIQRIANEAVPREFPDEDMKTATTAGVVRAGALMAIATVVSRVTGLLSKIAILAILGVNFTSTAYTVANTLPNIIFELLIGGVLTSVAIPLLTRAQRSDEDGGLEYTQRLLTITVVGLAVATVLAVLCAPLLARLYLPPGQAGPEVTDLTTKLGRFLLPQMFFYGVAALFGAILNTKERFTANAWAPVLNNVVVIGVAIVLWAGNFRHGEIPTSELLILGIGTTLGIVLQAVVMIPSLLKSGFRFKWRWGWDSRLAEAGGLVGWAVVYVLISQVGVVVTTNVANHHDPGSVTVFSYASLLFQMPYGILGVAVLTAIMPRLSRHAASGQLDDVKRDVSLANRLSAVALLPVSAAFIVLGSGLAVALFNWKNVTLESAQQIGLTISGLAIGLVPLAMTLVQMRVFYAMKDGRTPTMINGIMVAVRVPLLLLSMLLAPRWVIPGLALATAISYMVGAVVGEIWLRARFGRMGTTRTLITIGKMLVSSIVGGAAAFVVVRLTIGVTPTNVGSGIAIVLVGGVVGLAAIAVMTTILKVEELAAVRHRVLASLGFRITAAGTPVVPTSSVTTSSLPPHSPPTMAGSPESDGFVTTREQVTERVTQAPAGGPRNPDSNPNTNRDSNFDSNFDSNPPTDTFVPEPTTAQAATAQRHPAAALDVSTSATSQLAGPPMVLAPGATVGSRYRLVSLVGSDDAGNRFWRAKDTVLPRDMAVTLLPDTSAASATVARTLRVGRLHHIGLPQTLDVGTEHGQSYVVGQWVDGATLTDLVAGGPLEPDVATSITAKIAEAVAEAHRNGIALGAINPSLVRVNFDGQVRLSHVIAHGDATPDQDIKAVGGLLYLMLTGTWPLRSSGATGNNAPPVGNAGQLVPAPTRMGREVPASEVRPGVPAALSALAERALHPEDPAGIHAVGAITALLRPPEIGPAAPARELDERVHPALNPAEKRLVKERRTKLGIATVMIAAFSALIIIVVASLAKQLLADIAGPSVSGIEKLSLTATAPTNPATAVPAAPVPAATTAPAAPPGSTASVAPAAPVVVAVAQKIVGATVYDPKGDGVKDMTDQVELAFDGNPQTSWETFIYKQQFPTLKPGVGLTLQFAAPITPTSVVVTSESPNTTIEIRSAAAPDLPYEQTTALGTGIIATATTAAPGSVTINLTAAPKSGYLVVFVVQLGGEGTKFRSHINEIVVNGS